MAALTHQSHTELSCSCSQAVWLAVLQPHWWGSATLADRLRLWRDLQEIEEGLSNPSCFVPQRQALYDSEKRKYTSTTCFFHKWAGFDRKWAEFGPSLCNQICFFGVRPSVLLRGLFPWGLIPHFPKPSPKSKQWWRITWFLMLHSLERMGYGNQIRETWNPWLVGCC